MPRVATNYENTIMYKIVCSDLEIKDCYVGHTTNFTHRKSHHKGACHNPKASSYNTKVYVTIRNNGGFENWSMAKIEDYKCNSLLEACKRERELYEEFNSTMNTNRPYLSHGEVAERDKQYRLLNIDTLRDYLADYRLKNKESIVEQREKNKEKLKEYRDKNKDAIKEQAKAKVSCEFCKKGMRRDGMWKHLKICKTK